MPSLNTIRTLTVQHRSEGADRLIADLRGVAAAETSVGEAAMRSATVTEQSSRRQLSAASALDREMKRIDASYRARENQSQATSTFDRALQQGLIDTQRRDQLGRQADEHYTRMLGAAGRNDNDPSRRGLSTYDKQFGTYQLMDVASTLGSGGSLATAAAQQGPQLLQQLADRDGGLKAGLKQLGQSAVDLVTPFTIGATAVTGLAIALGIAASQAGRDREVLEKATLGLGAATGATVSQLNSLALGNAEAGKVSTSTAREIVAGYSSMGTIAIPVIGDLTRVTSEYARLTGQDTVQATAELGRAFSDLSTGVDTIASKMGGLSDAHRQLIQAQIEQGDRSGAQQSAADILKGSVDANTTATRGWGDAWDKAKNAAWGYWEIAKQISGIKLGIIPEGAQEAYTRLTTEVERVNRIRSATGMEPLNGANSSLVRQQATAQVLADQERRIADGRAAEERANQASDAAGRISRAMDPNAARLSELRTQQSTLRDALADPLARSRLADPDSAQSAYVAATRAIDTLTDSTGKLIDRQEMARRGDQLRLDALKAGTDAEKAAVAERQKAFDLIGKTITGSDAAEQIKMAGRLSLAGSADKGGSKGAGSDAKDELDRAMKSVEDRIRRQDQEAKTFGMGAEAAARYRTETDLLTAAKRAERDITPSLTAQIADYANQAGGAARAQEQMREAMQGMDQLRSGGRDVFGGLLRDMSHGTTLAGSFANALSKVSDRLLDMTAGGLADSIFGKRGSSDGLFGLLSLGGGSAGSPLSGAQGPSLPAVGGLLSTIKNLWPFANGGIMSSNGPMPLPLHAYANGGIADQPQMAIFAEAGKNEAFVPLPDGKRIPVALAGGQQSAGTPSNTDARSYNIDLRGSTLTRAEVQSALAQAISQHDKDINRTMGQRFSEWRERY